MLTSVKALSSSSLTLLALINLSSAYSVDDTIGTGGYQAGGPYFNSYLNASLHPTYRSSFSFTGYNLSNIPPNVNVINSNSSENWSLNLNYSVIHGQDNQTESNLVYSLTFPEEELPIFNSSDWQLCAHVADLDFRSNITDLDYSNDGSCLPFFGRECYDAVIESLSTSSAYGSTNCPSGPALANIPACRAHFGTLNYTVVSFGIMNFTESYISYNYNNHSYVDSRTGRVVDPSFIGLRSGNPYAYNTVGLANDTADTIRNQARKLTFSALTLTESPAYRASRNAGNGHLSYANNPRLICGRAVRITGNTNGASGLRTGSFLSMFVAILVSSLMYL